MIFRYHNFTKFDSKFVICGISQIQKERADAGLEPVPVKIRGRNGQQISEVTFGAYIFKDSVAFQPDTLEKLCSKLQQNSELTLLKAHELCQDTNGELSKSKFDLLSTGKQVSIFVVFYCTVNHILF